MQNEAFKKVFRNELTWLLFIIGTFLGVFNSVILPLQKIQLQISQIQSDIQNQNFRYEGLAGELKALSKEVTILKANAEKQ